MAFVTPVSGLRIRSVASSLTFSTFSALSSGINKPSVSKTPSTTSLRSSFQCSRHLSVQKSIWYGKSSAKLAPKLISVDMSQRAMTARAEASIDSARASHILVSGEEQADEILARLNKGEDFAKLARENSSCPSGMKGGDLGWFKRGMMVPEFEQASFEASNLNKVVKVKTQFGWHLLTVTGQRAGIGAVSAEEFKKILDERGDQVQLVDVREEDELRLASLPGFINLPLTQAEKWAPEVEGGVLLDKSKETIVMCHHGMRSAQMCGFLERVGFDKVKNLTGGINAYSNNVDPSIPTY